jgi:tetratricopeptide (TPR) repeat protein
MRPEKLLYEELKQAGNDDHVALTRHLCEKLLRESPDFWPALIRYAIILIDLALYDDAERVLDRAETVIPRKFQQHIFAQRGHRLAAMGDLPGAEKLHRQAHQLDPLDPSYLIYAASIAFKRGNIQRAEKLVRQATECDDGALDEAFFNLGGYLLVQKKYQDAKECYLKAIEIDPDYDEAHKKLADLEKLQKRIEAPE